ncbi:T9SS type A sorting domain-containing protein [Bernardetia sp. ABR2-2B]|uniref:T9SS type A sorting domain-containing protein n=1 Tax=Bernardetia sp. ABR2-2B TaxID=3127472 RepID=UPI0030CF2CAA
MKQIFTAICIIIFAFFSITGKIFAQELESAIEVYIGAENGEIIQNSKLNIAKAIPLSDDSKVITGTYIVPNDQTGKIYGSTFIYEEELGAGGFFVARISKDNNLLWIKTVVTDTLNPTNYKERYVDIDISKQNEIYLNWVAGIGKPLTIEGTVYESVDNLFIKYDIDGRIIWQRGYDFKSTDIVKVSSSPNNMIKVDEEGNFYTAITVVSHDSEAIKIGNTTITLPINWNSIYRITGMLFLKFNSNGNLMWHRTMMPDRGDSQKSAHKAVNTNNIIIDSNGNVVFAVAAHGSFEFTDGDIITTKVLRDIVSPILYDANIIVVKFDKQGRKIFAKDTPDLLKAYAGNRGFVGVNGHLYTKVYAHASVDLDQDDNIYIYGEVDVTSELNNSNVSGETVLLKLDKEANFLESEIDLRNTVDNNSTRRMAINKQYDYFYTYANRYLAKIENGVITPFFYFKNSNGFERYATGQGEITIGNKGKIYAIVNMQKDTTINGIFIPRRNSNSNASTLLTFGDKAPYAKIKGNTFVENATNCNYDGNEAAFPRVLIKSNQEKYTVSDRNGLYRLTLQDSTELVLEAKPLDSEYYRIFSPNKCDSVKEIEIENGRVLNPQDLNFGFKVLPCSYLTVDITNQRRRRCFMSSTTVEYKNQGFATAQNVEVKVDYPDYIFPVSSVPSWTRKEGNSYFFDIGSLDAGNIEKIILQDSVVCGIEQIRGLTQCVKATISPANSCQDWTDNENKYEITGRCVGGGIARYVVKNLTNTATDSIPYRLYANSQVFREANTLLPANGEVEIEVFTNGMTMRMELFPQNHDPISAFVEGCQTTIPYKTKAENPNPVVSVAPVQESGVALPQNDGGVRSETSCSEILDSYDPNDKQVVPFGLTNQNLIEKTTELDYTIRFQNTGTIEAVNIVVLDTLSDFLDIETIRLGMVSHDYKFFIDGDENTRVLRFQFDNINLPDSNSNEPESHGFIKFKIKQKANNAIGTVIKNRAAIYFDFNSPIITNTISNKVAILPLTNPNLNLSVFNCSDANSEIVANAGTDIQTSSSTITLAAQNMGINGIWTLVSGFGELEDASKSNSKVTGVLPFPTTLVWRVAVCGEAKQDTIVVQSINTDYNFDINFDDNENTLSVPTGKVTYQWYRDGVLITGQTDPTLDLTTLDNRMGVYTVVISSGDTSITSEPFTIDRILSNNDFIKNNYIKVYPNPTTSLLNVELNTILNTSEVTLVNALGMELQKAKITNSNKITLDLNNLSNGIYFVKIISQKGIFYKKVVLKK